MTVSFHKYGEYFPGTGELRDIGVGAGKNYSVNFPLRDGIDDQSYKSIFEPVIGWVMKYYNPSAVVLQCGGDSLSGDRLGCFNLSMRGHANCVNFVKSFNLPTLILGGGGYTMRNVARAWAFETGQLVGMDMSNDLPFTDYYEYYSPDFELDVKPSNMDNANSPDYLERIKMQVLENLKRTTQAAPSVQMHDVPRAPMGMDETLDEEEARLDDEEADLEKSKDKRITSRMWDRQIERDDELDPSDDEDLADSNGVKSQPGRPRMRMRIMDHLNPHAPTDVSGANTPADDDARSMNGDDEMEDEGANGHAGPKPMHLDGAADEEIQEANAVVGEEIVEAKATSKSPAPPVPKVEEARSDRSEGGADAGRDDDMEVDPAAATPAVEAAQPPDEGAPAPATDVEMSEDAETEREKGLMERTLEDAEAEATTEMEGGGHNVGGGPAV